MRYLITAPAPARRIADGRFALESAYVQHIRDLKRLLGPRFTEIILAMPAMSEDDYRKQCQGMAIVDEAAEGIRLVNPYRDGCTKLEFLLDMPRILRQIWRLTKLSDVITPTSATTSTGRWVAGSACSERCRRNECWPSKTSTTAMTPR